MATEILRHGRRAHRTAAEQRHRLDTLKLHAIVLGFTLPIVGAVWAVIEHFGEGTWSPWFLGFVVVWLVILGIHALVVLLRPSR